MGIVEIETARLRLRPLDLDDVDAVHRLWTEPDVRRYLWDDQLVPHTRAAAIVDASLMCFTARGFGLWAIRLTAATNLSGFCGLRPAETGNDIELLYGLAPRHWGCGLATEAARAVLRYGFETLRLARIIAATDAPNVGSIRVLERLGMRYETPTSMHTTTLLHFTLTATSFRSGDSPSRVRAL